MFVLIVPSLTPSAPLLSLSLSLTLARPSMFIVPRKLVLMVLMGLYL